MMIADPVNIIALLSAPGVGRKTAHQLLKAAGGGAPSGPNGLRDLLAEVSESNPRLRVPTSAEVAGAYAEAEGVVEAADRIGVRIMVLWDPEYPELLRSIPDPPLVLYVKGSAGHLSAGVSVAVIGTREPSPFGAASAGKIAATLAWRGVVVVGGLALGCDTAAHEGCIDAGGATVAVLAHGPDRVYPSQNRDLADRIVSSGGCLISEYPPGTKPRPNFFVERDRIQSGLCAAVIVVETDVKGGTMHTAGFCSEQGRLLACLRHPAKYASHPKARGNRLLIDEGRALPLDGREDLSALIDRITAAGAEGAASPGSGEARSGPAQPSFLEDAE